MKGVDYAAQIQKRVHLHGTFGGANPRPKEKGNTGKHRSMVVESSAWTVLPQIETQQLARGGGDQHLRKVDRRSASRAPRLRPRTWVPTCFFD